MIGILWGSLALVLLALGMLFGWHRWVRPNATELDFQAKGMLALAILAAAGGLIGSPFWWLGYRESFSWQLPPLASRMLAAAGISFAVVGWLALERMQQRLIHLYIVLIAVYLAPLVVAIGLLHLDRFDWAAPITYGFFLIAGGMTIAALWHLIRRTALGPAEVTSRAGEDRPAPTAVRLWMWAIATIAGLWGVALFVLPNGPWPQIWVWAQDPLTSRLIATMLLTLSAGAIFATSSRESAKLTLWMLVTYGIGVAAAGLMNQVAGKPVPVTYVTTFGIMALISLVLLMRLRYIATKPTDLR